MTTRTSTLPRDLKPGDKIERVNRNMDFVLATVKEVKKVKASGSTAYKVYMEEYDTLSSSDKNVGHGHLVPFIVTPRQSVAVVTE